MQTLCGIALGVLCVWLSGCGLMKPAPHVGPWPQDMFTVFDGRPSTEAERDAATNDCLGYAYNTPHTQGPVIDAYQICMLQLGFRAPSGELAEPRAEPISEGSCIYVPDLPVCMAEKQGWPLHPIPRWTRPNTSRYQLEGDASVCSLRNTGVKYTEITTRMDKCMTAMGYSVADPHSPIDVWPAESTWPNCAKRADQRNWIERKWCPPGPAARSTTPDSEVRGRPRASSRAS